MMKGNIKSFNEHTNNSKPIEEDILSNVDEKIKCRKFDDGKLLCSTCKNYCTITGEKIPELKDRF